MYFILYLMARRAALAMPPEIVHRLPPRLALPLAYGDIRAIHPRAAGGRELLADRVQHLAQAVAITAEGHCCTILFIIHSTTGMATALPSWR